MTPKVGEYHPSDLIANERYEKNRKMARGLLRNLLETILFPDIIPRD